MKPLAPSSIPPRLVSGLLLAAVLATGSQAGEFTISGTWLTGTQNDEQAYSSESLTLRFATGDRVRFRAYLPYLRLDQPDSVVWSVVGPTPVPPGWRRSGPGVTDSGNGGVPQGPGPGGTSDPNANEGTDPGTGGSSQGPGGTADPNGGSGTDPGNGDPQSGPEGATFDAAPVEVGPVSGLGDVRVGLSARLLGSGADLGRLTAELDVKAPTAESERGLGTGEWDGRVGMAAERRGWYGTWFGGGGWTRFGDPDWIDLQDSPDAYVGFESEPWRARLAWSAWIEGAGSALPENTDPLYLGLGVRREAERPWQVSAWIGLDESSPDVVFMFSWSTGSTLFRAGRHGDRR